MNRLPTQAEVKAFLSANATRREDDRWDLPSLGGMTHAAFGPAALKIAEVCLILGVPLSDVLTSDFVLILARRVVVLEAAVAACSAPKEEVAT